MPAINQQLTDLVDSGSILPEERLAGYSIDGVTPRAVVRPQRRQEIVDVIRWAASEGVAVFPWGGGTQVCLGGLPGRLDLVLDLSRYDRVIDYQPADLTATVEAGISLDSLQQDHVRGLVAGTLSLGHSPPLSVVVPSKGISAFRSDPAGRGRRRGRRSNGRAAAAREGCTRGSRPRAPVRRCGCGRTPRPARPASRG